jgi:POT family proton-dependent oligopeptide transporter
MVDLAKTPSAHERTLFGHPIGLFVLFATEMWERFSYYGMKALLMLYMTDYLFLRPDAHQSIVGLSTIQGLLETVYGPLSAQGLSSQVYGLYTGLVYLTPLFGGILADQLLGARRTVMLGACLMAAGHFLMASEALFLPALFLLILGNGAFKPNISVQVGTLYAPGDPRRDGAFTIFYMGINLGAMLAPLTCGTLGQTLGWHYGFGLAGIGMVLGLIIYVIGGRLFLPPEVRPERREAASSKVEHPPLTAQDYKAVLGLAVLCTLNIVFWGVYEQQGLTMQLWADRRTDWNFFGFEVPSTWYQSLNPALILVMAPVLDAVWRWQARHGGVPSSVTKMGIGCVLLGCSFLVMVLASRILPDETRGSVLWLGTTTLILTLGELYLSPIGLSLVTKVAPARIVSMVMGMWMLSSFFGNYISGVLGLLFPDPTADPEAAAHAMLTYEQFFQLLSALGIVTGLVMLVLNKPLRAWFDGRAG